MTFRQVPGGSSRSSDYQIQQTPMRDEATVSTPNEHALPQEVGGMDDAGWSNSPEAKDAPKDAIPEVAAPIDVEPGFSNSKAARPDPAPEKAQAEAKVVEDSAVEDKAVKKAAPAKKSAAKKSTSKKG